MALLPYALTTLANAKSYLGITTTEFDALLELLINSSTDWIEKQVGGRRFKKTSYTDELYDGNGSRDLFLKNFPVVSITKLEQRTGTDPLAYQEISAGQYVVDKEIGRVQLVSPTSLFDKGVQNFRITYEAGFDFASAIPADLELICLMVVAKTFNMRKSEGIASESLGAYSVSYVQDAVKADEEIKAGIANFKKYFGS